MISTVINNWNNKDVAIECYEKQNKELTELCEKQSKEIFKFKTDSTKYENNIANLSGENHLLIDKVRQLTDANTKYVHEVMLLEDAIKSLTEANKEIYGDYLVAEEKIQNLQLEIDNLRQFTPKNELLEKIEVLESKNKLYLQVMDKYKMVIE